MQDRILKLVKKYTAQGVSNNIVDAHTCERNGNLPPLSTASLYGGIYGNKPSKTKQLLRYHFVGCQISWHPSESLLWLPER